ncbi:hypothetical protein [Geodermatophilus ruber]|uniref:Uncharacterized protein n=1 Tax=Geodermatophilus ruber TaxID=504800 RepID=A0A1I4H4A8_9ACTN|nr:hypothetical protein [Geodermatophilus ruber]SFL36503.1 hypothetical protein SAMN04488085_1105 [Geodermatophilus ruber]
MECSPNPVTDAIDGATGDITMSGDAMRWSPELAEGHGQAHPGVTSLPGLESAAGFGSLLGLDGAGVRRLVSGAVNSLATAAGDVVSELRQLTRGGSDEEEGAEDR